MTPLESPRLMLIPGSTEILQAAIEGPQSLAAVLRVRVPDDWTEFGTAPLQYALDKIRDADTDRLWWMYFPIHREDEVLVGCAGYKGAPNEKGEVEIGYEITPGYRRLGLATEMAATLVGHAFRHGHVNTVTAHTLAFNNASTRILQNLGFQKTGAFTDPDDGPVWAWALEKNKYHV